MKIHKLTIKTSLHLAEKSRVKLLLLNLVLFFISFTHSVQVLADSKQNLPPQNVSVAISDKLSPSQLTTKLNALLSNIDPRSVDPMKESPELFKKTLESIQKIIESQILTNESFQDPHLIALYNQLDFQLKHAAIDGPGGRYAFMPSLHALRKSRDFFEILSTKNTKKIKLPTLTEVEAHQKEIAKIEKSDITFTKKLIENPEEYAVKFTQRLENQGYEALFPELSNKIRYLEIALSRENIIRLSQKNPKVSRLVDINLKALAEVQKEGFPYLSTVNAIEDALAALDIIQRGDTKNKMPALYHSRLWQHNADAVKGDAKRYVMIPTLSELGFIDFLKIRAMPIGLAAVTASTPYADGHPQTSLEFWFHDFNHSRRMWQQYLERARELGLTPKEYQKLSHKFITEEVIPLIETRDSDTSEERNMKSLMSVILFEVAHEEALPLDRDLLKQTLERPPLGLARFVYETTKPEEGTISYALKPAASILALTFRKIEGEFYDKAGMRMGELGSPEIRTREAMAKAAKILNTKLGLGIDPSVISRNVSDDSGLSFDFRKGIELNSKKARSTVQPLASNPKSIPPSIPLKAVRCVKELEAIGSPERKFYEGFLPTH